MQAQSGNITKSEDESLEVRAPMAHAGPVRQLIGLFTLFRYRMHVAIGASLLTIAWVIEMAASALLLALILSAWLTALAIGVVTGALSDRPQRGRPRKLDILAIEQPRASRLPKNVVFLACRRQS